MGKNGAWWAPLIEKAAAKYVGFYKKMHGYFGGGQFFRLLTNMPMTRVDFTKNTSEQAWNLVTDFANKRDYPMASSHKGSVPTFHNLIKGHGYGILRTDVYKGTKLIKLRNPWAVEKYTGPWSDKDTVNMNAEAQAALNHTAADDGAFYMAWDDFYNVFNGPEAGMYEEGWKMNYK
jgi:hypothetical protein